MAEIDPNDSPANHGKAVKHLPPFALDKATIDIASAGLKTVLDLIVFVNARLSEHKELNQALTDPVFAMMITLIEEDIEENNVWDFSAAFVFKAHFLPLDKSQLLMYSVLTPMDIVNILNRLQVAVNLAQAQLWEQDSKQKKAIEVKAGDAQANTAVEVANGDI